MVIGKGEEPWASSMVPRIQRASSPRGGLVPAPHSAASGVR